MLKSIKQLISRIETLEKMMMDSIAVKTPAWDYSCCVCENGIHTVDATGKHVIACKKKIKTQCADFTFQKETL